MMFKTYFGVTDSDTANTVNLQQKTEINPLITDLQYQAKVNNSIRY